MAYRCQKAGFEKVDTEVLIKASYQDFRKFFYVDLLLNDAMVYELKTVKALTGEHHQQTLNYFFNNFDFNYFDIFSNSNQKQLPFPNSLFT